MLGLVSPILNRGVRSRWVSTLPAGSKMLTIDAAGDVSYTDIPTAAWGSITGTLSSQTDLQNALNAKLSLSGGTLTGQLTNALGTITASTPLTLTQTWNNAAVTFTGALLNVTDTASNASSLLMDLQIDGVSKVRFGKDRSFWLGASNQYQIGIGVATYPFLTGGFNIGDSVVRGRIGFQDPTNTESGIVTIGTLSTRGLYLFHYDDSAKAIRLFLDAANILAQRNGTNAQTFRIYNTYTDASNYERGKIEWSSNVLRIGTEKAGTGSARALELQTDGTTRLTIATNGDVTTASNFSVGNNSIYLGGSGVIRLADYTRIHTPDSYGPIDIAPMTNNVTGVVRVYNTIRSLTNYERLECGQAYNANAFIRTAAGGTGTRRNLEIDAPEIKIAIATTQKIGFYNATPVVQPAAVADATDAASVITQLNLLLSRMRDLGLIAT